MTEAERLRKFAEGCIYIANGVRDGAEAARLKALAADALAKAEALEREPVHQQQQPPVKKPGE